MRYRSLLGAGQLSYDQTRAIYYNHDGTHHHCACGRDYRSKQAKWQCAKNNHYGTEVGGSMPKVNFSKWDEATGFQPLPAGKYLVKVEHIDEKYTQSNDEMWNLTLGVLHGPLEAPSPNLTGKKIFDNIVWSGPAMPRAKLICKRFGIDVDRDEDTDVQPKHILQKEVVVQVGEPEEYTNAEGKKRSKSSVVYAGYFLPSDAREGAIPESDIPF